MIPVRVPPRPHDRPLAIVALLLALAPACALDEPGDDLLESSPDAGSETVDPPAVERFSEDTGVVSSGLFYTPAGPVTLEYEEIDGHRVFEGDILLPAPAEEIAGELPEGAIAGATGETSELVRIVGHRWRNGVVPYTIPRDFPNRERILWAMSHIENRAGVNFVRRNRQKDFITFRRSTGCASFVGRQGGRQIIYLADACSRGSVVHELLHALGMFHEQSRPNRNDHVRIRWRNIQAGTEHNFRRVSADLSNPLSTYDLGSIMHYGSYAFSRNGRPTIVRRGGGLIAGQRDGMSHRDASGLDQMY